MTGAPAVGGYVIYFSDGGPSEEQVIVRGTYEECERMRVAMPGVVYRGTRPIARCEWVTVPDPSAPKVVRP